MQRRKFIALPNDDTFHLTPKLWMAIGVIAYNHYLLTLQPVQILSTARDARHIPPTRIEAAAKGQAAMLSTEGLTPATRSALTGIARTLLTPFASPSRSTEARRSPSARRTPRYLLIADVTPADELGTTTVEERPFKGRVRCPQRKGLQPQWSSIPSTAPDAPPSSPPAATAEASS